MKISQKNILLIATTAIILLTVGKLGLIQFHHYPDKSFGIGSYSYEPTSIDSLDDSIRDANNKLDALKQQKELFTQGFKYYSGYTFTHLGIVTLDVPENHSNFNKAFLKLTAIGLKFDDNSVHGKTYLTYQIRKGQPYLVTKKLIKNKGGNTVVDVFKRVNFSYSTSENSIFILLESTFSRFLVYAICFIILLTWTTAFLFLFFTFFKFLISIAKNNAFERYNVQRLRDMSITLFILALGPYLIDLIIYLIFIINHSSEGVIITRAFFEYDYYILISAILCYLVYTAFEKAMILKEESELTI